MSVSAVRSWLWLWLTLVWALGFSGSAWAQEPDIVQSAAPSAVLAVAEVDVRLAIWRGGQRRPDGQKVPREAATVAGVAVYHLDRPARAGEVIRLLDFASSMPREPEGLDEVKLSGYVDGPFDAGKLELTGHWGALAVTRQGARDDVVVELPAGAQSFTLAYDIHVPHRYWPFGCVRRRCSLAGTLAPLPSEPAKGGTYLEPGGRVVSPVRWRVESAEFAIPGSVAPRGHVRTHVVEDEIIVAGGRGELTPYPSVFFGRRWVQTALHQRGLAVQVHTRWPRPSGQVPDDPKSQLRSDLAGIALRVSDQLVDVVTALGMPPKPGETLVIVEGPLRSALAQHHPGVVLVSDQAFELFPVERLRKFHEDALARSVADALVLPRFSGHHDASTDLWLSGMVSYAALNQWRVFRRQRDEFAQDLLSRVTFVPAVDRFLYTQQASFSGSYFRGVEDEDPVRDHALWFAHGLPTGRRLHEKLVDTLGRAGAEEFYRRLLVHPHIDPRRLAEQIYGRKLDWFFEQWLGPYPAVDYGISDVHSVKIADRWRHDIVVSKHSRQPVVEPVQLLVIERGGKPHYLVWNGELGAGASLAQEPLGGEHHFVLETDKPIKTIRIDPRARTLETPLPPHANVDPLFNNRKPAGFRFLYTGVGLSVAASEFAAAKTATGRLNAITGFAMFESSLRRDLRRTGNVQIARDRETDVAVGVGASFWFGRKVNRQRRRARVRVSQSVALLNGRSLDPRGGVRLIERLSLTDDTRGFFWWPERGRSLEVALNARHTLRTSGIRDDRHDFVLDASWVHLWRLAKDHVVATSLTGEMILPVVGGLEYRGLSRVGGIGGLSGYTADEAFGRGTLTAQVELRQVFVHDLGVNLVHLAWLRSLGGIAFAGVSTASSCESLGGWFGKHSWYASAGYALTAYLSILGVTPQLVRLEVAAPIVRYDGRTCLGQRFPDYLGQVQGVKDVQRLLPKASVNVTFTQSF